MHRIERLHDEKFAMLPFELDLVSLDLVSLLFLQFFNTSTNVKYKTISTCQRFTSPPPSCLDDLEQWNRLMSAAGFILMNYIYNSTAPDRAYCRLKSLFTFDLTVALRTQPLGV